jgi:hypothetical protein
MYIQEKSSEMLVILKAEDGRYGRVELAVELLELFE